MAAVIWLRMDIATTNDVPHTSGKGLNDIQELIDQGYLASGSISMYYSDGSQRHAEEKHVFATFFLE